MSSPVPFPLLSSIVALPVLASLLVVLSGKRRASLGYRIGVLSCVVCLLAAVWMAATFFSTSGEGVIREPRPWIVNLGVSYVVGIDGLSTVLVLWVALLSLVSISVKNGDYRTTAGLLVSESLSLGLFLARDVFLILVFYFGVVFSVVLLARARRKVFIYQLAGLALLSGVFVRCHQMVYAETGFASTELLRWRTLVLYPDTQLSLFVIALAGIAVVLPLFPFASWLPDAVEKMPSASQLYFFGSFSLAGSYLLFRVFLPMCSLGVASAVDWFLGYATLSLAYAALVPGRGWGRLLVGLQALVLVALLSTNALEIAGAGLQMTSVALGMAGLALGGARVLSALFTVFLVVTPVLFVLPSLSGHSPLWRFVVPVAFLLFALRVFREAYPLWRAPTTSRRRLVLAVPLVVWCLSMAIASGAWREHLLPSAREFLGSSSTEGGEH